MITKKIEKILALVLCGAMALNGGLTVVADTVSSGDALPAQIVGVEVDQEVEDTVSSGDVLPEETTTGLADILVENETVSSGDVLAEETKEFIWFNDEITVKITADADVLEEVGSIEVTSITEEDALYAQLAEQLEDAAATDAKSALGFYAYDIAFLNAEETEVYPEGEVKLTVEYADPIIPAAATAENVEVTDIVLMHLEESEEGAAIVTEMNGIIGEEANAVKSTVFTTDIQEGFSIVWFGDKYITFDYTDEDVTVRVTGKESVLHDVVGINVTPIKEEHEQYAEVAQQLEEKIAEENEANEEQKEVVGFLAYDITLVDSAGNELEPDGNVSVSIEYNEAVAPEDAAVTENVEVTEVTVMHHKEDIRGEVEEIVDMVADDSIEAAVITTENKEIEKAEFVTDSFSTFSIVWYRSKNKRIIAGNVVTESGDPIGIVENGNTTNKKNITVSNSNNDTLSFANVNFETITDAANNNYDFVKVVVCEGAYNGSNGTEVDAVKYEDGKYYASSKNDDNYKLKLSEEEYTIYFVYQLQEPLTVVETVDHVAAGIVMKMTDYDKGGAEFYGLGGGYGNGTIKSGLVKDVLVNGYPQATAGNQQSLENAFKDGKEVNYLFLKSTYDATGYYEYNSFDNYAYLGDGANFTVYEQLGTPNGSTSEAAYFYQRGNFLPYNAIEAGKYAGNYNLYDEFGAKLSTDHTRYAEKLYQTQGRTNYYFGMYMEVPFAQPKDGFAEHKGQLSPMRYEFNGDDDLWVFIDDVLVLDIGGIHDAHSGYIDFSTGEVGWYDCQTNQTSKLSTTTIKEMYKAAGKFPDGTAWDDDKVAQYFDGNTYVDYTPHVMKMFYMERGEGASNLHVKFNIPVIPRGTFEVTKELTNTDKEKYANVEFAFQAFAQEIVSEDQASGSQKFGENYVPLTDAVYKTDNSSIQFHDNKYFDGKKYDNVFYLKPGETAVFSGLQENRKYYVVEVGVNTKEFDKVVINGVKHIDYDSQDQVSEEIQNAETGKVEVSKRPLVVYENNCSAYNSRELRITKQMRAGQTTTDTFTFKVLMENQQGSLAPYVGSYYMMDSKGNYYYFNADGALVNSGKTAILCGTSTEDGLIRGVGVGYTIVITQILSGTEFQVTEVNADGTEFSDAKYDTPEKTIKEGTYDLGTVTDGTKNVISDGAIKLGENAEVTITNSLKVKVQWELIKKSSSANVYIEGAKFKLVDSEDADKLYYGISGTSGKVKWYANSDCTEEEAVIAEGTYTMTEIQAPVGYAVSSETWTITVTDGMPEIKKGGTVIHPAVSTIEGDADSEIELHTYYFENEVLYELPSTGGSGMYSYVFGGITLMLGAAYVWFRNRRKEMLY